MLNFQAFLNLLTRQRASFLEQISASAGSFVFFMLSARALGPSDFGLFALHLVPAQIVHSVAVHWLLLPITTTPGGRPPAHLVTAVAMRLSLLIAATPPFALIYAGIAGLNGNKLNFVVVVTILCTMLMLFDIARYFAIRLDRAALQVTCNTVRWLTSFLLIAAGVCSAVSGPMLAVIAFVSGILASLLVTGRTILMELGSDLKSQSSAPYQNRQTDGGALLSLGLSNAVFTLISSSALARANLAAFGAIQAFRSLVNWAPLILQYLETHFAATLARSGRTAFTSTRWLLAFVVAGVIGEAVIIFCGDLVLALTVGSEFAPFLWLFAVMYALVLVQSYTRTIGIEVRLVGAVSAIWMQVLLLAFGGAIIAVWMTTSEGGISTVATISVMLVMAVVQALTMALGLRLHKLKSTGA